MCKALLFCWKVCSIDYSYNLNQTSNNLSHFIFYDYDHGFEQDYDHDFNQDYSNLT